MKLIILLGGFSMGVKGVSSDTLTDTIASYRNSASGALLWGLEFWEAELNGDTV